MNVQMFMKEMGYSEQTADPIHAHAGVVYWYRKVPDTKHHQFVVRMWPGINGKFMPSFEVEMTYETRNEVWANTKYYGLTYTQLCANLNRLEGCLKASLVHMDANPLHYQYDGE